MGLQTDFLSFFSSSSSIVSTASDHPNTDQKDCGHQWTRTKVSSSPLLLFRKTCHIFANLRNPLWRALASKPLNRLSSVTPFYKWEAMMNLHILSDPVPDFWKCPKKGFKKSYLRRFLVPNFAARHMPPSPGVTHERERGRESVVISCSSL